MAISKELYELIVKIVDDRVKEIKVTREEFDEIKASMREGFTRLLQIMERLIEKISILTDAQRATEERLNKLAEAQRATEERLNKLIERVDMLTEAQKATEERLNELAEAQKATEERLNKLAEAQRATEERLNKLIERVDMLAEAQRVTEESLRKLADTVGKLSQAVGRLSDVVGYGLEDVARVVVPGWLERHLDIYVEGLERRFFYIDGREGEVNLYGEGVRDGGKVVVIGECRSRIYGRDVEEFIEKYRLIKNVLSLKAEVVGLMFGFLVHPSAEKVAGKEKIYLIASYMK